MMKTRTRKRTRRKSSFSKVAISVIFAAVGVFTAAMIILFAIRGSIPDTLVISFFGFVGGEAGILGMIKTTDTKYEKKNSGDSATEGFSG